MVFGYDIEPEIEANIIQEASKNRELNHLSFERVKIDVFGNVKSESI